MFSEQGQERKVINHFQTYTNSTIMPKFAADYSEVTFSPGHGSEQNIKISKGEESNFVWSIFYSLLELVIEVLDNPEEEERDTDKFNQLEYIFIDDPVTSLDDNHLIHMAVDLAQLIKKSQSDLKFVITTHSTIFYNVLFNELGNKRAGMLIKNEDGTFDLESKDGDSNTSFSYHRYLMEIIDNAISENKIEKFHFILLRNLYEKTANFLGYKNWSDILPPDGRKSYETRIMNFYSHQSLLNEEMKEPTEQEKQMVKFLFEHLIDNARFQKEVENDV